MASVRRIARSPYWIAKFRDGDSITFRSTKQKNRSKALEIALDWERLARLANDGELTKARVLDFGNDLLKRISQDSVGKVRTQDFAKEWLTKGVKADTTRKRYEAVILPFLEAIGKRRAMASIGSITTDEIENFRDAELSKGKSASTADFGLKVLRAMLENAKRKGFRLDNPADGVDHLSVDPKARKPFTDDQLLKLIAAADEEWEGMILFGALAGIRLNDAANLKWSQVNLEEESLRFLPAKTMRKKPNPITVALHPGLVSYLKSLTKPKHVDEPIFPALFGRKSGSAGGLSNLFTAILVRVGLRAAPQTSNKKSPSEGRSFNELGFHSTRHYFISRLANADVPAEVRKAMAGHSADEAHAKYIHLELATQRRALSKISGFVVQKIPA